jgi:hypothetical protein
MIKIPVAFEKVDGTEGRVLHFRRVIKVEETEGYQCVCLEGFCNKLPLHDYNLADTVFAILDSNENYFRSFKLDNFLKECLMKTTKVNGSKIPVLEITDGKISSIGFEGIEEIKKLLDTEQFKPSMEGPRLRVGNPAGA